MSSFICSAKHFNSITDNATRIINEPRFNTKPLKIIGLDDLSMSELRRQIEEIVNTLKFLNVICWTKQYDEKNAVELFEQLHEKICPKKLSRLGLKNAVDCLMYQIEIDYLKEERELEKSEKRAMDFLNIFSDSLASLICDNLPDDKTNAWSID